MNKLTNTASVGAVRFEVEPCTFSEAAEHRLCVWPLSGSGEGMIVCGDEREAGKSYCAKHVRKSAGQA